MDLLALWGKTGDDDRYHPLLCHLLDVAIVSQLLWSEALPGPLRLSLVKALGLSEEEAKPVAAYLAGLHDLGKAAPGFQAKSAKLASMLPAELAIPAGSDRAVRHGLISAREMVELAGNGEFPLRLDRRTADILGRILGGHHGIFPSVGEVIDLQLKALGNDAWRQARLHLATALASLLGIHHPPAMGPMQRAALVPLLAGLVTVADWIGSSDVFPPAGRVDINSYLPRSKQQARDALRRFGWLPTLRPAAPDAFSAIFPFPPNALQSAVAEVLAPLRSPYLLIVEAPMGLGKTEAALFAADHNLTHAISGGFFIGLPTQATTNAMHRRIRNDYLASRGHLGNLDLQLIHGHAGMIQDEEAFADGPADDEEGVEMRLVARQWFQGRKRPLLAPFGVGTVDQALLAVLQTRHWFVRLFGLAGKTVIFDEIHAYDTYMSTILETLLGWLAALDCSVILLSATLPPGRRRALIQAYGGVDKALPTIPYPRLTLAVREPDTVNITVTPISRQEIPHKQVALKQLPTDPGSLAERLAADLADGGCAAIICNTVNQAQRVYSALRAAPLPDTDYLLFHARMPYGMRAEREERVLARFGKSLAGAPERYARRAVLVATQVVEQSLDLDFDWMASEMAPVDLLLQRLGRLHRHQQNDALRPSRVQAPALHLLCDADPAGPPPATFGDSEYIYARYILLRTWLALRGPQTTLNVPDDMDDLIAQVYECDPKPPTAEWAQALQDGLEALTADMESARKKAEGILIKSPRSPRLLLNDINLDLADDDDPSVHPALRAATRDGRPSITVVCLHDEGGVMRPWGSDIRITADQSPDREVTRALLRAAAPVSQKSVFHALCNERCPAGWRGNAHLRHARALMFHDGIAEVGNCRLILDDDLGLIISRKEEVDGVELQPD